MLTGGEKEPERIMNIMYYTEVSLFKFFGKYPAEKGKKRVGTNLVRRLEWWTHKIMINSAFMKKIYTILYSKWKGKATQWVAFLNEKLEVF